MTSTPTGARQNFDPSQTTQLRVASQTRTGTFRRIKKTLPKYDYEHYGRLAGPSPSRTRPSRTRCSTAR